MKTKVLLVGAVVAAFALASFAAEPLLSPRANANQIKIVTSSVDTQGGTVTYITSVSPALRSPRGQANQIKLATGTDNDVNPYVECRNMMTGSPKVVQACIEGGRMQSCVTVAPLK